MIQTIVKSSSSYILKPSLKSHPNLDTSFLAPLASRVPIDSGHESRKRGESFKTRMKMDSIYDTEQLH